MQDHAAESERGGISSAEELLDRLITQAESKKDGESVPSVKENENAATTPMQGLLGGLDPKWLALLPQLLSGLQGRKSEGGSAEKAPGTDASTVSTVGSSEVLPAKLPSVARHMALISALKPYLGPERRQAAEGLLGMCRTLDTLQKLGVSLPTPSRGIREVDPDATKEV